MSSKETKISKMKSSKKKSFDDIYQTIKNHLGLRLFTDFY